MSNKPIEIKPLIKPKETKIKIQEPLPTIPFRWLIVAATFSGKTNMYVQIINDHYSKIFKSNIILIAPTYKDDETLQKLKVKDHKVFEEYDDTIIDQVMEEQEKNIELYGRNRTPNILMIFDDIIDQIPTQRQSSFTKLFTKGRHYKINVIVSSQDYHIIPKIIRNNVSHLTVFSINAQDVDKLIKELPFKAGPKKLSGIYEKATSGRYDFMFIDMKQRNIYHNFNQLLYSNH